MAAPARLSPAANLLRNSKLFALPPAIPLPPSKPSAEPTAGSDTATTIHPTRAAIATPQTSLLRGDWGLKRALPLKSTTDTSTPSVRLAKDIDSSGHVTDFESAADHVQTHAKWQDVHFIIKNKPSWTDSTGRYDGTQFSVFHPKLDSTTVQREDPGPIHNTDTDVPSHLRQSLERLQSDREAAAKKSGQSLPPPPRAPLTGPLETKRWRYEGPWLAGMTELEFDAYLNHLDKEKMVAFENQLKHKICTDRAKRRAEDLAKAARVASKSGEEPSPIADSNPIEVTEEELRTRIRMLRQNPAAFGPEIAEFLDLPDGAPRSRISITNPGRERPAWQYRRHGSVSAVASPSYETVGPPRTHPSAGFSYVRSNAISKNNPRYGPQLPAYYLPARLLKDRSPRENRADGQQAHGVGGFVSRVQKGGFSNSYNDQWAPQKSGPKFVAQLSEMTVAQDGSIELETQRMSSGHWLLKDNVPISKQQLDRERSQKAATTMPPRQDRLERLDDIPKQTRSAPERDPSKPNDEIMDALAEMQMTFKDRRPR